VFALSGCGGGGDDYYVAPEPIVEMHYLTDSFGDPVPGVGYDCLSGEHGVTDPDGGYYFDPYGDSCDFYLSFQNVDLHIEYENHDGVDGLLYRCVNTTGFTGEDNFGDYIYSGYFEHTWNIADVCTIDY